MRQDPTLAPWRELRELLGGYFVAKARGLLGSELVLSGRSGEEFGRLRVHGSKGAELETGSMRTEIDRTARSRYEMPAGDAETLVAELAEPSGTLKVWCGSRLYEARVDLLRNTAVARSSGGEQAARVAGGLTNRSYEAVFDAADDGSLPLAVFLLYHTVALRRRAFLAAGSKDP
jgi:hypothetical protein